MVGQREAEGVGAFGGGFVVIQAEGFHQVGVFGAVGQDDHGGGPVGALGDVLALDFAAGHVLDLAALGDEDGAGRNLDPQVLGHLAADVYADRVAGCAAQAGDLHVDFALLDGVLERNGHVHVHGRPCKGARHAEGQRGKQGHERSGQIHVAPPEPRSLETAPTSFPDSIGRPRGGPALGGRHGTKVSAAGRPLRA